MSDRTNQAVDRLAAALHELSYRGRISIKPDIRMLVCPGDPTPEDVRHLHGIGLSADTAELLADAINQLLRDLDSGTDAIARSDPELARDVASAFDDIDVDALARAVLDDAAPQDRTSVTRAIKAMFRTTQDPQEDGDDS